MHSDDILIGTCVECGAECIEARHGLKKCSNCALQGVSLFACDAFGRAVAALLRDVVEEHGVVERPAVDSTDHYGPAKDVKRAAQTCNACGFVANRLNALIEREGMLLCGCCDLNAERAKMQQGPSHIHAMARQNAYAQAQAAAQQAAVQHHAYGLASAQWAHMQMNGYEEAIVNHAVKAIGEREVQRQVQGLASGIVMAGWQEKVDASTSSAARNRPISSGQVSV